MELKKIDLPFTVMTKRLNDVFTEHLRLRSVVLSEENAVLDLVLYKSFNGNMFDIVERKKIVSLSDYTSLLDKGLTPENLVKIFNSVA